MTLNASRLPYDKLGYINALENLLTCWRRWRRWARIFHPSLTCLSIQSISDALPSDTNIVSDLIRNPQGTVAQHIRKVGEEQVCTSVIVAAELRYGAAKKGFPRLCPSRPRQIAAYAAWADWQANRRQ